MPGMAKRPRKGKKHWSVRLDYLPSAPCEEALLWCRGRPSYKKAWKKVTKVNWLVWLVEMTDHHTNVLSDSEYERLHDTVARFVSDLWPDNLRRKNFCCLECCQTELTKEEKKRVCDFLRAQVKRPKLPKRCPPEQQV